MENTVVIDNFEMKRARLRTALKKRKQSHYLFLNWLALLFFLTTQTTNHITNTHNDDKQTNKQNHTLYLLSKTDETTGRAKEEAEKTRVEVPAS